MPETSIALWQIAKKQLHLVNFCRRSQAADSDRCSHFRDHLGNQKLPVANGDRWATEPHGEFWGSKRMLLWTKVGRVGVAMLPLDHQ